MQVARQEDDELRKLNQKFVCVRMVKMNGVDLRQFQFDYDLTWAAFFLNGDGTVYARYGSRSAEGPMTKNSIAGLKTTMRRVLAAHAEYPKNKALFEAKRGPEPRYRRPELIPSERTRRRAPVTRENCIHCHNIYDAYHDLEVKSRSYDPLKVYKYPLPENIGVVFDVDAGTEIDKVLPGSPASKADLRQGDVIVSLGGQAMLSIADVQFVLHHLAEEATIDVRLERSGKPLKATLRLSGPWRKTDFSWRVSMYGLPPNPGLYVHMIDSEAKKEHGIDSKDMGLEVRNFWSAAVRRSGLKKGDVIIAYDGKTGHISAPKFHEYIRFHHYRPGSVLKLDVLRKGEKRRVEVKF